MTRVAITGASRGIGREAALAFAARDCQLILLGRRSSALDALRAELHDAEWVECDLSDGDQVERAGSQLCRGPVDVLVNNAAVIQRAPLLGVTREQFEQQLAVNLTAPFLLTRAVLAPMLARGSGRVIQVASISATLGTANSAAYNATKWGLVGFMKSVAEELRDSGVMTCALLPGSVDTSMLVGSGFAPRMSAADVARTLVFLGLDASLAHNGAAVEMFGT